MTGAIIMKKKFIAAFIVCMAVTGSALAESQFSDLPEEHWAYSYVNALVEDGTVNGKEPGIYAPDDPVTRAEFVKMIGAAENADYGYSDVSEEHWGYEFIMASGVEPDENGNFRPDEDITRNDVLDILYSRYGSTGNYNVSDEVKAQGDDPNAVAWGYFYNIMRGDDGVNLRLSDTITRAEVAKVIYEAKQSETAPIEGNAEMVITTGSTDTKKYPAAVYYEENSEYPYYIKGIDQSVYTTPYYLPEGKTFTKTPAEMYNDGQGLPAQFDGLFIANVQNLTVMINEGWHVELEVTYYPSMVRATNNSYVHRVKCKVLNDTELTLADMFETERTDALSAGLEFWADVETDHAFGMGVAPISDMQLVEFN